MAGRLVLATRNRDKARELRELLEPCPLTICGLDEFPGVLPGAEEGETLEENAICKAAAVTEATSLIALADDTGLFVDALGGAPGVLSARFAGPGATYLDNNRLLLSRLSGLAAERRTARFVCAVALAMPGGRTLTFRGECPGLILEETRGERGFGYDPLFLYPLLGRTFAEMDPAEKNKVSHRARAVALAREYLIREFGEA